jgi:chlorobactene glucosyltransferase
VSSLLIAVSTTLTAATIAVNRWIHSRNRALIQIGPTTTGAADELVSICIPARNEARGIRACVEAALGQTYPNFEMIVLDDRSSDETRAILQGLQIANSRLKIIDGAPLPTGWAGKPHALQQAAQTATGAWLCFVDADTILAPQALAACHAEARRLQADLLSIMTRQVMGSFWERTLLPLVMSALAVGFPPDRVNDPNCPDAIANGQFILVNRTVFNALGGYAKIRDRIDEDKALAELIKWNGYRLVLADGKDLASTRMYSDFAAMWEGWTKNIYLGLRGQPRLVMLGIAGFVLLTLTALILPLWPTYAMWWLFQGGGAPALVVLAEAVTAWTGILRSRVSVAAAMGIPHSYALTTPLGCAVFAAMMLVSTWNVLSGRGVTWRGRRYVS